MTWIVIIDNGESYSDHTHWTACTCKDKETAERAVAAYHAWRDAAAEFHRTISRNFDDERAWQKIRPCPFPEGAASDFEYLGHIENYTASAVEVPEWAEGRP